MKILYNFTTRIFILLPILLASCANDLTYNQALVRNQKKIDDPNLLEDSKFLVEAKSFNLLQVQLAELAVNSGYAAAIVDLARQQLADHKAMNDDLATLARKKRIALPAELNEKHAGQLAELRTANRENFDRDFLVAMQRINTENKEEYLSMATEANDEDVRAFSARKLDMLRAHEVKMEDVKKQLMNTY